MRRRALMKQARLPSGYQEVEYIENHKKEYISYTNLSLSKDYEIHIKAMKMLDFNKSSYCGVTSDYDFAHNGTGKLDFWGGIDALGEYPTFELNKIYEFAGKLKDTRHYENRFFIGSYGGGYITSARFYYVYVKYENDIKAYFVPCYRKSDGEIGMYEMIKGIFCQNAGTGAFTKGEDIL